MGRFETILFVTGTDTGVGKTVLTALLVRHLNQRRIPAVAVKPFCSGGRSDARHLLAAQPPLQHPAEKSGASLENQLSLDLINPWHFRAALTPSVAAQREGARIRMQEVTEHLRARIPDCAVLLVEGAGGLRSPLGESFDSLDLIRKLKAVPIVVGGNRLGAINQMLMAASALGKKEAGEALFVLMQPPRQSVVSRTNVEELKNRLPRERLVVFPWAKEWPDMDRCLKEPALKKAMQKIENRLGL